MPCDSKRRTTAEDRRREEAIKDLEAAILSGKVTVSKNFKGEPVILNWSALASNLKTGFETQACALHFLSCHGGWIVKQKLASVGATTKALAKMGGHHH